MDRSQSQDMRSWGAPAETFQFDRIYQAIDQVLAAAARLPESEELTEIRERCLLYEGEVLGWAQETPSTQVREAMMKKVIAVQLALAKLHRPSISPTGHRA